MSLEKLTITPLTDKDQPVSSKAVKVLFNPASYSISKTVNWSAGASSPSPPGATAEQVAAAAKAAAAAAETNRTLNAPILNFGGGAGRTLSMELFFDVTEPVVKGGSKVTIKDVREETDKVVKLTRIDRNLKPPRPPVCEVSWGGSKGIDFPFRGVLTSLTQNFSLFSEDGKPLRAKLTVAFMEVKGWKDDQLENDPEFTTRVVKLGDSLSNIAAEMYADPKLWRTIAEANNLDDPRRLQTGMILHIPKSG